MDLDRNSNHPLPEALTGPTLAEASVLRVLQTQPTVQIPADFAARVTALAVAQTPRRRSPWADLGPRIAIVSSAVLTATLFAFAPHAVPSLRDLHFDLEMLLLAELGAVGYVLTRIAQRD